MHKKAADYEKPARRFDLQAKYQDRIDARAAAKAAAMKDNPFGAPRQALPPQ
jgi:hypothetical protein